VPTCEVANPKQIQREPVLCKGKQSTASHTPPSRAPTFVKGIIKIGSLDIIAKEGAARGLAGARLAGLKETQTARIVFLAMYKIEEVVVFQT